jgi:hypothetical protein
LRRFSAGQAAHQESGACTHPRALVPADGRTRCGAYDRADHRTFHPAIAGRLAGRYAANTVESIVPALHIVGAKLVKAFAGARQNHHAGTGWYCGAGCEQQGQGER